MVFRVEVKERIGEERSFTQAIRAALQDVPGVAKGSGRQIGMGGMFKILGGTSKMHVQPDWSTIDKRSPGYYDTDKEEVVGPFLQFYTGVGQSPLTCVATLWSHDPTGGELGLRPSGEHTHCFR